MKGIKSLDELDAQLADQEKDSLELFEQLDAMPIPSYRCRPGHGDSDLPAEYPEHDGGPLLMEWRTNARLDRSQIVIVVRPCKRCGLMFYTKTTEAPPVKVVGPKG